MQLTASQIQLVKQSWKKVRTLSPELVADIFYTKLFNDNSRLRKMFPADMQSQYKKLMDMLTDIITRLDTPNALNDDIIAMAKRHAGYGVKPAHYKLVGNALIWTLKKASGSDWTTELETAWINCYNFLADTMIHAAESR